MNKLTSLIYYYKNYGFSALLMKVVKVLLSPLRGGKFNIIQKNILNYLEDQNNLNVRYSALANGVSYVYGCAVKGDIVEFGTNTGLSAVSLATAITFHEQKYVGDQRGHKKLFLFDSFVGLPEARFEIDKNSHHVLSGFWAEGTCKGLSEVGLSKVISRYLNPSKFFVIKGWFKDTVPKIADEIIFSMVHIDGDLYESTIDALDSLFNRKMIANGAMLFFDDFDCNAADLGLGERLAWSELIKKYNIIFSDMGPYSDTCHRFIIHCYKPLLSQRFDEVGNN